jgi:serine/threonine-protein kinase
VPLRVLDDVAHDPQFGFAQIAIADNGVLMYVRSSASGLSTIRWLDGGHASRPLLDEPARYQWPRLSPDGKQLAYGLLEGSDPDIWTLNLSTGVKTRLTGAGNQTSPVWTPDSRYLIYSDVTKPGLFWQRADGTGSAQLLVEGLVSAWSFTADGSRLAHHAWNDATSFDLATLTVEVTADGVRSNGTETLLATRAFENYPAFSPDGRWVAYCSNESGAWEVYVRAYPSGGERMRVSASGGCIPAWSPNTELLFYETVDQRMMALEYRVEDGLFVAGEAELWSSVRLANTGVIANFDASSTGVVALVAADAEQPPRDHVTLVTSFHDQLRRTVRAR